jgi:hypothetical protein
MKAWGSRGITPPFLTSALDGSGQLHVPVALPLRQTWWQEIHFRSNLHGRSPEKILARLFTANASNLKSSEVEVEFTLRLTVGQSVSQYALVLGTLLGPMTRFSFSISLAGQWLCSFSWGAPSDERTGLQFVLQSLGGQSRGGLITVSPETTGFPFRRLLRLAGISVEYSYSPPHGDKSTDECHLTKWQLLIVRTARKYAEWAKCIVSLLLKAGGTYGYHYELKGRIN